jgi:hypothetical protein
VIVAFRHAQRLENATRAWRQAALSAFVRVQAVKSLSLAQRQVFGDRYKVPRLWSADHRRAQLPGPDRRDRRHARTDSRGVSGRAERALRELGTSIPICSRWRSSGASLAGSTAGLRPEIDVDPGELEKPRELGRRSPLVFVPSHKSNFDHLALYSLLFTSASAAAHRGRHQHVVLPDERILPGTGAYCAAALRRPDLQGVLRAFINSPRAAAPPEFFIEAGVALGKLRRRATAS